MKRAIGCGIDFGTTNSSIAVAYDDGTTDVVAVASSEPRELQPSLVFLHRSGTELSGEAAIERYLITGGRRTHCTGCDLVTADVDGRLFSECGQFRPGGACMDARLIAGIKSELSSTVVGSTHSWARDFTFEHIVSVVLRDLKRRAERHVGESLTHATVGRPIAFPGVGGPQGSWQDQLAEERLIGAARAAGFEHIDVYEEPLAAIAYQPNEPGVMVSLDFGGGTFDASIVEVHADGSVEHLASQGAAIGGQDFDAALFEIAVEEALGLRDSVEIDGREVFIPAEIRTTMRTLAGVRVLLNDPQVLFTLRDRSQRGLDTSRIEAVLYAGFAYEFYRAVEEAKIELSSRPVARIRFVRPGLVIDEQVTRSQFERAIARQLERIAHQIDLALQQAGKCAEEVGTVVVTGGSGQVPAFMDLVRQFFPDAQLRTDDTFTSVARGLAVIDAGRVDAEEALDE